MDTPAFLRDQRDRWELIQLSQVDPRTVERLMREGAGNSDFAAREQLCDLMLATWPMLAKCALEVEGALRCLPWEITPYMGRDEDTPSKDALKVAQVIEDALHWMPSPDSTELDFEEFLGKTFDAALKGVSVWEIIWQEGAKPAPRGMLHLPGRYYGYSTVWNDTPRLLIDPTGNGTPSQPWEGYRDQLVAARFSLGSSPLFRAGLLRPLAALWVGQIYGYEWFMRYSQIFGLPIRWANYDSNAANAAEIRRNVGDMLANLGAAGWGAFPTGTSLNLHEAGASGNNLPQKALMDVADTACQLLILGQTLTSDAGDRGTQALGTVHASIREDRMAFFAMLAERVCRTQLFPAILRMKGLTVPPEEIPCIKLLPDKPEDAKALADRDKVLNEIGLPLPLRYLYERHGVPMPEKGEPVLGGTPAATPPGAEPGGVPAGEGAAARPPAPGDVAAAAPVSPDAILARAAAPAQEELLAHALSNASGIAEQWLAPLAPDLRAIIAQAQGTGDIAALRDTTAALLAKLEAGGVRLRPEVLGQALNGYLSASFVNGCLRVPMALQQQRKPAVQAISAADQTDQTDQTDQADQSATIADDDLSPLADLSTLTDAELDTLGFDHEWIAEYRAAEEAMLADESSEAEADWLTQREYDIIEARIESRMALAKPVQARGMGGTPMSPHPELPIHAMGANQTRWPKGHPLGGQWTKAGGGNPLTNNAARKGLSTRNLAKLAVFDHVSRIAKSNPANMGNSLALLTTPQLRSARQWHSYGHLPGGNTSTLGAALASEELHRKLKLQSTNPWTGRISTNRGITQKRADAILGHIDRVYADVPGQPKRTAREKLDALHASLKVPNPRQATAVTSAPLHTHNDKKTGKPLTDSKGVPLPATRIPPEAHAAVQHELQQVLDILPRPLADNLPAIKVIPLHPKEEGSGSLGSYGKGELSLSKAMVKRLQADPNDPEARETLRHEIMHAVHHHSSAQYQSTVASEYRRRTDPPPAPKGAPPSVSAIEKSQWYPKKADVQFKRAQQEHGDDYIWRIYTDNESRAGAGIELPTRMLQTSHSASDGEKFAKNVTGEPMGGARQADGTRPVQITRPETRQTMARVLSIFFEGRKLPLP